MRIGDFFSACELDSAKTHEPWRHPDHKLEYHAPEGKPLSFASDMFSVGVTLFEMATGKLPDPNNLDRDQLLATIDDPRKHELISFALHAELSKRPTAEELLQKIATLAPSSMLESQFRAQVFASMRFGPAGPMAEAKLLRGKLASQGVHLHIISLKAGESITRSVFDTMATCDAFIAMATQDVRGRVLFHLCALTSLPRAVWTRHGQPRGDVPRSARVEGGARARRQAADPAPHGAPWARV